MYANNQKPRKKIKKLHWLYNVHKASESDLILESLLLAGVSGVRLVEFGELKIKIIK